ncbi:glycoside hydrolase family 3 N-terminal domain-containing protein [Agromyces soli]
MRPRRSVSSMLLGSLLLGLLGSAGCAQAPAPSASPTAAPTLPTPTPSLDPEAALDAWVDERLASMSLEQKAASLLMLHAPGTDAAPMRELAGQGIAGLILMGDNMPDDPASLAALTAAIQADPEARTLVAIDEEGGEVQRLPWDDAASAEALRTEPAEASEAAFARRAGLLADVGVDVNFGVVADVTGDPDSFIFGRVLGTEPVGAAERTAAAVRGEHGLVASTLKHFPGHGQAPGDSHESLPTASLSREEWAALGAPSFTAGIEAGAELVMTGHLVYPAIDQAPASLSAEWHRILRDELGFEGVVVTDDMLMLQHNGLPDYQDANANAVRAVASGADLLLYVLPADPSEFGISVPGLSGAIADAVREGRIPSSRLDDAARRVLELRRAAVVGMPAGKTSADSE